MRRYFIFFGLMFLVLIISSNVALRGDFPVLKGPYLGQTSPGKTAKIFAPQIISTKDHEVLYGF